MYTYFVRPDFFISWLTGFFFKFRVGGGGGGGGRGRKRNKIKIKPSENDQLNGHFQRFLISPEKNSKTSIRLTNV